MKPYAPLLMALMLLSTCFVGVSNQAEDIVVEEEQQVTTSSGSSPMDSAWPMYCHDTRHTGRSSYSVVDTWNEIWRFRTHKDYYVDGSPIIGDDGTIYFGGLGDFYALYPNGTLKWKYDDLDFYVWSAPAIDENGVIYVGDLHGYFYAINPDGTLKWRYCAGDDILSSPAIGEDGIIYFGDETKHINALWPNGTVKWRYKTGHVVLSSPAIGEDGTVYCGSHDTYLYALYPNDGTVKWKYKTGGWIRVSPCIADDGTIYVVSFDGYLYAIYPNGTLKWTTNMGEAGTSPTIGQDGTIYAGYTKLRAFYPDNGSVKWTFDPGENRRIRGSTPCHSAEDIIIFGTHIGDYEGGEIIVVNPDGTERWRKMIANEYIDSAPAIGKDGTIYVGSASEKSGENYGYLHAFGTVESNNPPEMKTIEGRLQAEINTFHKYSFSASDPDNNPVGYFVDWGDGSTSGWTMDYEPDMKASLWHEWKEEGNYTIKVKARDSVGAESDWISLEVTMPKSHNPIWWLNSLLDRFPLLSKLLESLMDWRSG
jgi:outer membrane protein assembly factor BamB